jgi:hypothetical protein
MTAGGEVTTGDIMRDRPPITLCFGNHGIDYLGNPLRFQDRVREALRATTRKVGVFVEDVSVYPAQAEYVLQRTMAGEPLIASYLQGQRIATGDPEPTGKALAKEIAGIRQNESSPSQIMMARLDELTLEFPGRCGVLYEYPSGQQVRDQRFIGAIAQSVDTAQEMIDRGDFEQAMPLYFCSLMAMATLQAKREPRMVEMITRLASIPDVSKVLAFVGTDHSLMQRAFQPPSFRAERDFFEKEGSSAHYFAPESAIWRQVVHEPRKQPSKLDWHRAMLGEAVYRHAQRRMEEGGRPSRQQTLAHIHRWLRGFTELSQISEVETRVPNEGMATICDQALKRLV